MLKKKSPMSLKDFHGGSIPSDFSLPSGPGVYVRPGNPSQCDRPNPRGSFSRTHFPNAPRFLDDKSSFLAPSVPIGRHFDEDERTPLNGSAGPRKTIGDKNLGPSWMDPPSNGSSSTIHSYKGKAAEGSNRLPVVQANTRTVRDHGNPWGIKKDPVHQPIQPQGISNVESKFINASALDKVSSGNWQTKQPIIPSNPEASSFSNEAASRIPRENTAVSYIAEKIETQLGVSERPKLKLLPRTKPLASNIENFGVPGTDNNKERDSLYGGARPRELVLKERGMSSEVSERGKHKFPTVHKMVSKDEHLESERGSWRKEVERQPRGRATSPETWRKPIEQPKLSQLHLGKTASALELTQAFTGSLSDSKAQDFVGKSQVRFSRLMEPAPHLNGL